VVRNSLRTMQQTTTGNEAARFLSRAAFRTIGRLPPLKRRFATSLGNE
jgi:hypothetical protein